MNRKRVPAWVRLAQRAFGIGGKPCPAHPGPHGPRAVVINGVVCCDDCSLPWPEGSADA